MFSKEFRPLKRPKLGIPDFYPQEDRQKEVRLVFYGFDACIRSGAIPN